MKCPYCKNTEGQVKDGKNDSGSQRYLCQECERHYTPDPKPRGYPVDMHKQAVKLYLEGMSFRAIGRTLDVNHQTVINWIDQYAAQLPDPPTVEDPDAIELDELFTFVGKKKQ